MRTWLEHASIQKDPQLYLVKGDPWLKNLEGNRHFKVFPRKINLPVALRLCVFMATAAISRFTEKMRMNSDTVKVHLENGIVRIEINRPEKKNALTQAIYVSMAAAFEQAERNPAARVVLIHGQSNVFTSGNDLKDFMKFKGDEPFESGAIFRFLCAISGAAKPVIAAVNGAAIGIGTTLLLHCDLVYAGESAVLQLPFVNLGLCPEAASSYLLPRLVGYQRAAELLLLGEPFSAHLAREFGLVTEVVRDDQVLDRALARARQLAAQPPSSVRTTKGLLKHSQATEVLRVMSEEASHFAARLVSAEAKEAFTAFVEKRKPNFSQFD